MAVIVAQAASRGKLNELLQGAGFLHLGRTVCATPDAPGDLIRFKHVAAPSVLRPTEMPVSCSGSGSSVLKPCKHCESGCRQLMSLASAPCLGLQDEQISCSPTPTNKQPYLCVAAGGGQGQQTLPNRFETQQGRSFCISTKVL